MSQHKWILPFRYVRNLITISKKILNNAMAIRHFYCNIHRLSLGLVNADDKDSKIKIIEIHCDGRTWRALSMRERFLWCPIPLTRKATCATNNSDIIMCIYDVLPWCHETSDSTTSDYKAIYLFQWKLQGKKYESNFGVLILLLYLMPHHLNFVMS